MTERAKLTNSYGNPMISPKDREKFENSWMMLYHIPDSLHELHARGIRKLYIHKSLSSHLECVLLDLQRSGVLSEIKTYNGCFNPRYIRGYEAQKIESIHTWAMAIDFNAVDNCLGCPVKFSEKFLQVWRRNGWVCGADFKRKDGMHFQKPIFLPQKLV